MDCIIMITEDIVQYVVNEVSNRWLDAHTGINFNYEIPVHVEINFIWNV